MRYRGVRIRGWRAVAMLLSAIVAAWLAGLAPAAGQPVLRFGPGDQALRLDGHMALLRDPDGRMTLDDVLAPDARDRFETLPINLSLGYTQAVAWLRFTIENTGPAARALFIEFQPPFIDHIDVFSPAVARPAAAADFHETRLGDHVDIADKPVFSLNNVVPVTLPPGEARDFYVRVESTSSLLLRGTLRTNRSLERQAAETVFVLGIYLGLAGVVGLINLIFWAWLRSPVHIWYAAYVLTLGLVSAALSGVTPVWLFPGVPRASELMVGSMNCLSCTIACYFVINLLELRQRARVLYRLYQAMALFGLIGIAATFADRYQLVVEPLLICAVILLFTAVAQSYRMARQGFAPAQLFLLSFFAQLVGLTMNVARVAGIAPTVEWTDYSYQAASAIHMILMNIGLARRVKDADAQARAAQAEALALAQQAESRAQAIAAERTRELEAAKLRAEAALAAEQEAQRAQVRFIDVISHQYRTPLSVIATNVEGIGMSLPESDAPNRRRIDRIRRAVGRLVAMIDVSLARSRLDGPPLAPRRRPVAPAPMLRQAVQRVRDATGDRIIGLELDDAVDQAVILADPEMIELALVNLIENAIKFSHADRPGVGIGLQLVAQLVHALDGEITVDSTENEGTSVTVSLPLAATPA